MSEFQLHRLAPFVPPNPRTNESKLLAAIPADRKEMGGNAPVRIQ
jgi:hypothetical protein